MLGSVSTRVGEDSVSALCGIADSWPVDAEHVLLAYANGLFPLDYGGKLHWHSPAERFVQFLDEVRVSGNMRRELNKCKCDYSFDRAPAAVLDACGDRAEGTWLTPRLKQVFLELHELGAMHSVEAWQGTELVGGSFGLSIGRVWTSESMFHRAQHTGKGQRMHLLKHLQTRGYVCVDSQTYSDHLARFGAREIPRLEYRRILARGLAKPASFYPLETLSAAV
jgi:leucyl/phenylalanyl-tRNA--protein transferase